MAESFGGPGAEPVAGPTPPTARLQVERIYLKDASWESPRSPQVFAENFQPEVQADINTRSTRIDDTRFEVVLTVTLRAKQNSGKTAFIVEVQQAGLFAVEEIEGEALQRVLATIGPTTLFPYAREAIDNLTLKGGFPALQIAQVNFEALYAEALRKQREQEITH